MCQKWLKLAFPMSSYLNSCKQDLISPSQLNNLLLQRSSSISNNQQHTMQDTHYQWIQPPDHLNLSVPYIKATLLRQLNTQNIECELQTDRGPLKISVPISKSYEMANQTDYADMCDMNVLNEPEVLNNIIRRYRKDQIFTNIGPTLIIVNPYRKIQKLFSQNVLAEIRQKIWNNKLTKEPPHVYLIAGKAYLSLTESGTKQAIVISGQSGAGKTQSTKYCMQLLTSLSHKKNQSIQAKILACNPLLEAFGNSKTVRNQNSSRFGKYVKIYFSPQNLIKGANIHSYLLQKSRVVSISPNQRSFHSFYALTSSGKYDTRQPSHYSFLRQSGCYQSNHIDDKQYFEDINNAFQQIGFSQTSVDHIWSLVSSILKLGNIDFDEANHIVDQSKSCGLTNTKFLYQIAAALRIDSKHLQKMLLYQKKKFLKEYTLSAYNKQACRVNRNTLCKAIYNTIFQFILSKIQISLKPEEQTAFKQINILDIFGFQNFEQNSFQQFCINFTNERLLKLYNIYVFDRQMEILKEDALEQQILGILPPNNDQIISIISGKLSLFSIINDMTLPQFKDDDIIQGFHKLQTSTLSFDKINKNKFCLLHTQCPVTYNIVSFKVKNQDKVNDEIVQVVNKLFGNSLKEQQGKTILSKFSKQIDDLIAQLNTSSVHFIRCIKPNEVKQPNHPDQRYILTQIRYLGIFQTIMIRRNIFPYRKTYRDFYKQYRPLFPMLKHEKHQKIVTQKIIKELTNNTTDYLLGNQRVYICLSLEEKLNKQIFKYLKLRNQKIRIIQIGLKKCMERIKILRKLKVLSKRFKILVALPAKLEMKIVKNSFNHLKQVCAFMKEQQAKERQQKRLEALKQAKKLRQQEILKTKQTKREDTKINTPPFINKLQQIINTVRSETLSNSLQKIKFLFNKDSVTSRSSHSNSKDLVLNVENEEYTDVFNKINATISVGDSVIDMHAPYTKPETPSSELIGKSLTFNQQFMNLIKNYSSTKLPDITGTIFLDNIQIQSSKLYPNQNIERLKNILSEKYKVQIQGSQEDFFSPASNHCQFKLTDLSSTVLNDIIDFPTENYFNKTLRKRTNFIGSKKTYQEILVFKKGVLNKSMTLLNNQEEEKKSLSIFKLILKMGEQIKIEAVLKHIQKFIELSQNCSIELKNQLFIQLIRQCNTSYQLSAIRIYQAMAVFLHVYSPTQDLLKATLNIFYWKLQDKKIGASQHEYLSYIFSIILRKLQKKTIIGYLPINYQVMGLMCKRQISMPVYLPTGNSMLVRVQAYNNFGDIKQRCFVEFGINSRRFKAEMFSFFQVVNFDNEQLQETPIKQTNIIWDMMTYWELTKNKYIESGIKPPNFFLMLKIRYAFQVHQDDEQGIQLCFSQLYFDYFMGRIVLQDQMMILLAAILKSIKYDHRTTSEIILGLLPLWVTKKIKRQQLINMLNDMLKEFKELKLTELQSKFKFLQIASNSPLAMGFCIPTEEDTKLYLKTKSICLHNQKNNSTEIISLKRIVKWLIQKQHFVFEVAPKGDSQENTIYRIRTDSASVCNQFLKCISLLKTKPNQAHVQPNFKKK